MDEAISALDSETEDFVYQLILRELPNAAMVSTAHRENVAQYHQLRWQFVAETTSIELGEIAVRSTSRIQCSKSG